MKKTLELIRDAWCPETSYGHTGADRSPVGQCAVTALLVQDVLGGDILRADIPGHGSHYWNLVADMGEIDLTRSQFPMDVQIPRGNVVRRSELLAGPSAESAGARGRYVYLAERYWLNVANDRLRR